MGWGHLMEYRADGQMSQARIWVGPVGAPQPVPPVSPCRRCPQPPRPDRRQVQLWPLGVRAGTGAGVRWDPPTPHRPPARCCGGLPCDSLSLLTPPETEVGGNLANFIIFQKKTPPGNGASLPWGDFGGEGGRDPQKCLHPPSTGPLKLCRGGRAAWVPPGVAAGWGREGQSECWQGLPLRGQLLKKRQPVRLPVFGDCAGAIWGYRSDGMGSMRVGR